jgi:hypothetical protein
MMDILFPILVVVVVGMIVALVMRSLSSPHKKHESSLGHDAGVGSTPIVLSTDEYSHLGSFDTDTPSRNDFGGGADFSGAGSGGSYADADAGGGTFESSDSGAADSGSDGGGSDGGGSDGGGGNGGGSGE